MEIERRHQEGHSPHSRNLFQEPASVLRSEGEEYAYDDQNQDAGGSRQQSFPGWNPVEDHDGSDRAAQTGSGLFLSRPGIAYGAHGPGYEGFVRVTGYR